MKPFNSLFLSVLILSNSISVAQAKEGHGSGSGGGVVECVGADGRTTSIAHDLFEGTQLHGYTYQHISGLSARELYRYLENRVALDRKLYSAMEADLLRQMSATDRGPAPSADIVTEDLEGEIKDGSIALPQGCVVKNAFRYIDYWKLQANAEVIAKLENYSRDLIVLHVHEVLYRVARKLNGDWNSKRVRALLAYAASDQARSDGKKALLEKVQDFWWTKNFWTSSATVIRDSEGIYGKFGVRGAEANRKFDCRLYAISQATWGISRLRTMARITEERGIQADSTDLLWKTLRFDQDDESTVAGSDAKKFFDWINASYFWVGKGGVSHANWDMGPFPFRFKRHETRPEDDRISPAAYERFLQYSDWVRSFAPNATSADYARLNAIVDSMNSAPGEGNFCRPTAESANFHPDRVWDLFRRYEMPSLKEAQEEVRRRFLSGQ